MLRFSWALSIWPKAVHTIQSPSSTSIHNSISHNSRTISDWFGYVIHFSLVMLCSQSHMQPTKWKMVPTYYWVCSLINILCAVNYCTDWLIAKQSICNPFQLVGADWRLADNCRKYYKQSIWRLYRRKDANRSMTALMFTTVIFVHSLGWAKALAM